MAHDTEPTGIEDEEIRALRANADFMSYLSDCEARARSRPRKTLKQLREETAAEETAAQENTGPA